MVEEDTVVERNGLEGSACWIADKGCEVRSSVWEGKGLYGGGAGLLVPLVAGVNQWGERSDTAVSLVIES